MTFPLIPYSEHERIQNPKYTKIMQSLFATKSYSTPEKIPGGLPAIMFQARNLGEFIFKSQFAQDILINAAQINLSYSAYSSCMNVNAVLIEYLLSKENIAEFKGNVEYEKAACYFLLMTALAAYNAAAKRFEGPGLNKQDDCHRLLSYAIGLVASSEHFFSDVFSSEETLKNLHDKILNNFLQAQKEISHEVGALIPEEMSWHFEEKAKRAKQMHMDFNGTVLFNPEASWSFLLDKSVLEQLVDLVHQVLQHKIPRQQVALYMNIASGHVIALDIAHNIEKNTLEIICVDSTTSRQQWDLLNQLSKILDEKEVLHSIIACQAGLQKDGVSCPVYTYYFCGFLAKLNFDKLEKSSHLVPQPLFREPRAEQLTAHENLSSVQWLNVLALGPKVTMMGQSFTEMKVRLAKLYPSKSVSQIDFMIAEFNRKHNITLGQTTFPDIKRELLLDRFNGNPFAHISWESLSAKLQGRSATKPSQETVVRRLAAGYGTTDELEFMLTKFQSLDINAAGSDGSTALHWSMKKKRATKAFVLAEAGADPDVKDNTVNAQSAKQLCKDSELADHPYFKRRWFS
tara:strand:- start:51277 stop:52992 length:1716 start_codon:yes stop_codon:yes gene_type:complete